MKNNILIVVFVLTYFLLSSCNNHKKVDVQRISKQDSIQEVFDSAKYVYIDKDSTLHLDRDCICPFFKSDENNGTDYGVRRVLKNEIPTQLLKKCCAVCVNDKEYEMLLKKNRENK